MKTYNKNTIKLTKSQRKFLNTTLHLLRINSPSYQEEKVINYVIKKLKELNFKTRKDKMGNVYAVRGKAKKYPLLNAHMDIVEDFDDKYANQIIKNAELPEDVISENPEDDYETSIEWHEDAVCGDCKHFYICAYDVGGADILRDETACIAYEARTQKATSYYDDEYGLYRYGYGGWKTFTDAEAQIINDALENDYEVKFDNTTGRITSNGLRALGGDDKCGIAIALNVARVQPDIPMKILFTVAEEVGCKGIDYFVQNNAPWLKNVKYAITIDRRGNNNLLTYACGKQNCTAEFAGELVKTAMKTGLLVELANGSISDVVTLRQYIANTVNISAGYHNPHTTDEWVSFPAMIAISEWIVETLKTI